MRRARHLVAGAAVGIAAIGVGDATSDAAAVHRIRATGAVLTGAVEVPSPGDPDGVGVAGVVVDTGRNKICYFVAVRGIADATAAHIHVGARGVAGPVVVALDPPSDGFSAACVNNVAPALAADIARNPQGYYVNVHNDPFRAGAIRGQLR